MSPTRQALTSHSTQQALIRVQRRTPQGFVEFAFGIDSTDLMVDLILPEAAFKEFCENNAVIELTDAQKQQQDIDQAKWQFGSPGITE